MAFRTKLDFSSNRQVKQHIETTTVLSGATNFGVPFSDLPTGPNPLNSGGTISYVGLISTFSGNSAVTIYNWYDPRMNLGDSSLSAITPSNSATTQTVNPIFTADTLTTIDGNTVALSYSGLSYDVTPIAMVDLGGGNYSGTVETDELFIYSAGTLDFTGRTIWADVSGITRTDRLIVTNNPTVGHVLTCIDSEGMVAFLPTSGGTSGSTSSIWIAGTGFASAVLSGSGGVASGDYSYTEGVYNIATGFTAHAEGGATYATGDYSHAEGKGSIASNSGTHAEGDNTIASGLAAHAQNKDTMAIGDYSHAEGWGVSATTTAAHAEGVYTLASGLYSHAQGQNTVASGYASHAEGNGTSATTSSAHSEGSTTIASGNAAHAEGENTVASGNVSHAQGYFTTASGIKSHAEGNLTLASGNNSHAEGNSTRAIGDSSHAGGNASYASGTTSFAHGNGVQAIGIHSVAYGQGTRAIGGTSFAIGGATSATTDYTFSEGYLTQANGTNSHAGGEFSIANGLTSFVFGSASTADANYSIVLGNGITGSTTNTTYVDYLNVKRVLSTAFANDIRIDANGNLTTNTSDERLKENITPLTGALDKIKALQGVTYQWKDRNAGTDAVRLGFIAQQVESVEPLLVFTNNDEEGYKGLHIDGVIPLLVEAIKELTSGTTANQFLETQTILAEDNNIDLNYNGTPSTAVDGGIRVLHAKGVDSPAELVTDTEGNWITNNDFKPNSLTIPQYTPTSSSDVTGTLGNVARDEDYIYIKTSTGWKRANLESF